jgi:hypothetical protein
MNSEQPEPENDRPTEPDPEAPGAHVDDTESTEVPEPNEPG